MNITTVTILGTHRGHEWSVIFMRENKEWTASVRSRREGQWKPVKLTRFQGVDRPCMAVAQDLVRRVFGEQTSRNRTFRTQLKVHGGEQ